MTTVIGSTLGLAGILIGLYFSQRNRRRDAAKERSLAETNARVADSKNALDAWAQISAAHTQQIATLDARVFKAEERAANCEEVTVPRMQTVIEAQRTTIADLLSRIVALEAKR